MWINKYFSLYNITAIKLRKYSDKYSKIYRLAKIEEWWCLLRSVKSTKSK